MAWLGLLGVCCLLWPPALAQAEPFAFPEARRLALARGWLQGYPDGELGAEQPVTRADLAAVTARLRPGSAAEPDCFRDVPPTAWYAPAVCQLAAAGLLRGYGDGSFKPAQAVTTFEALAVLLAAHSLGEGEPASSWREAVSARAQHWGLERYVLQERPLARAELPLLLFQLELASALQAGRPLPSSGCARPRSSALEVVSVAGQTRQLIVDLPPTATGEPLPLILAFHGRTNSNAQVRRYYDLRSSSFPALLVYPAALPQENAYSWWQGPAGGALFFDGLLDTLLRSYCVDLSRLFVVGHSLGATMANEIACLRGELLRGLASLAGGRPQGPCQGKVAAMILHNPEDELVAFEEGLATRDTFLAQNDLAASGQPSEPQALNCQRFGAAQATFPLLWCPHEVSQGPGGETYPHTWPEGTGEAMLAFFRSLP